MKPYRKLPQLDDFQPYLAAPSAVATTRSRGYRVTHTLSRAQITTSLVCRIIAASIMIETLFFKFTGARESVYIFSQMNMEAWWRYGQGIWELIASVLLLTPRSSWAGGILTLGALGAAILSHLTVLGIEIQGDHGLLFGMALVTFTCGFIVTYIHRHEIPSYTPMTPW